MFPIGIKNMYLQAISIEKYILIVFHGVLFTISYINMYFLA